MLSYNERLRGENTGWKMNFFIFLHKKYPYDFKIEIIGVYLFYLSSSIILYLVFTNLNKKTIKLNFSLPLTLFYIHNMDKISRIL